MIRFIDELELAGKKVFLRVDFNVPLNEKLEITDDNRIKAALPTIRNALENGARLIVASHLGRPKGKRVPELSLAPVAERLGLLLEQKVEMAPDCIGYEVEKMANALQDGEVLMLENLRFYKGETENDPSFADALASLCEVYVNDAFAVSHRAHASVVGVPERTKVCGAGFLMKNEITYFHKAMADPVRPLLAILGGAKVSSKLGAIQNILPKVDSLIIGGAMANTFLLAKGYSVGKSLVEPDLVETAKDIMKMAENSSTTLLLPVDVVVAPELGPDVPYDEVPVDKIPDDMMVLDIGPKTVDMFVDEIKKAQTIVWNGPMGAFEIEPFDRGTVAIARAVGSSPALSIVGGGDTGAAVKVAGESDNVSYISTGGGAFLTLLEGKELPGIVALEKCAGS
ncbi:MAG: phosphoglycerate kinase [Thermodesulfobacteria bacterium]|nr:phosphoglycerate kinase [Thermodesulfobacteriota bacterium]